MPYQYKREPLNNDEVNRPIMLVMLAGKTLLFGYF